MVVIPFSPEEPPAPLPPSTKGQKGDKGRGISSIKITNGNLIITYTDGKVVNVGRVKGDSGPNRKITVIFQDSTGKQLTPPILIPPNKSIVRVPIKRIVVK